MALELPVHELAETLAVLVGDNAGNAARHFIQHSYAADDVASALLWSNVVRVLEGGSSALEAIELESRPVPRRMIEALEAAAFDGVKFEDIDAETLAREEPQFAAGIADFVARNRDGAPDFRHPEFDESVPASHPLRVRNRELMPLAA
jgi:hypothetical protein